MKYKLLMHRIEPHPQAGQEMPIPRDGYWNNQTRMYYPDTLSTEVLQIELEETQWHAIRRAVLEVCK